MTRRDCASGAVGSLLVGATTPPTTLPLRDLASARAIQFGAAVGRQSLATDRGYRALARRECAVLVCENEMKWPWTTAQQGVSYFNDADWIVNFARSSGMTMRGHTLLWQLQPWASALSQTELAQAIDGYIHRIMSRYPIAQTWDVVNEPIRPTDGRSDGLKIEPFLSRLGPDYIERALVAARDAAPTARLCINEFGLEYVGSWWEDRRTALLRLVERLRSRSVPLDAIGLQSHLTAAAYPFSEPVFRQFLSELAGLGLGIEITELDVSDVALPAAIDQRDQGVADEYERYLSVVLDQPAVVTVITWGLTDNYTWLNTSDAPQRRADRLASRPLPFSDTFGCKPACLTLARLFRGAAMR